MKRDNTDTHNKLYSVCYGHYNHVLFIGVQDIDALDLQEKFSFPPFSLYSKFIHQMKQTWIFVTNPIFFWWALQSCPPYWDTRYGGFGFARKAFLSTIFPIMKFHPWNEANLDTHNELQSFCYQHYNHVLLIGTHDINASDLQESLFSQLFSL